MSDELPERVTLDLGDGVTMEFVLIPGTGDSGFRMGSRGYDHSYVYSNPPDISEQLHFDIVRKLAFEDEEPIHVVRLSPFYLGVYPVTQGQFSVWTGAAGIEHRNQFEGRPDHPAESMTWFVCRDFCAWLNERCVRDLPRGFEASLPLECQWEYACRGGTEWEYHSGDGVGALHDAGWYGDNSGGGTHAVGGKASNSYGLYDMHGNVSEWCKDAYDKSAYKKRADGELDPCVSAADIGEPEEDAKRVYRGGDWETIFGFCRSAYRGGCLPDRRNQYRGFRVCLFFGPSCRTGSETGALSECVTGDKARRQAAASEERHGDNAEVDLSEAELPDPE